MEFEYNEDEIDKHGLSVNGDKHGSSNDGSTCLRKDKEGDKDKREATDEGSSKYEHFDPSEAPKHIVRIPESSSNEVVCAICRDKLVGVFDEESGDWIWRNAIMYRSRVLHWSCYMETRQRGRRSFGRERSPQR